MAAEESKHRSGSRRLYLLLILALLGLGTGAGLVWTSAQSPTEPSAAVGPTVVPSPTMPPPQQVVVAAPATPAAVPTSTPVPEPTLTPVPLPTWENPIDSQMAAEAQAQGADFLAASPENTGTWQYAAGNFIHPLALEVEDTRAFVVDAGRVLAVDLDAASAPQVLLAPGDLVETVAVQEPLDLALTEEDLYVLDRAGDVYRYDFNSGAWTVDRYDRPVDDASGHYFVAIHAGDDPDTAGGEGRPLKTLLETNYKFVMQYEVEQLALWNLVEERAVDVSAAGGTVYVLQRALHTAEATVRAYRQTSYIKSFVPRVAIEQPRQLVATTLAVYVLDRGGRRLLALDPGSGVLLRVFQLPQAEPISAFWADASGERLLLAGRDRIYFVGEPERMAAIPGGELLSTPQPHDPAVLEGLTDFTVPIGGSNITFRDFQMPGAPRHYRLGVHQGFDLYWQPGTQVVAAAAGEVIRADVDYVPPTAAQLSAWWTDTQARGYTSPEILDRYMGRQVWVRHANGFVSRYAHLRAIAPGIAVGATVERGAVLGEVGNSGSPASLEGETADAHLHYELWLGDNFLGQYLRPIEAREWVEQIYVNR